MESNGISLWQICDYKTSLVIIGLNDGIKRKSNEAVLQL